MAAPEPTAPVLAIDLPNPLRPSLPTDQGEEGLQSGSVAGRGIALDSGGKQSSLMEALKAFSLAFSSLSCAISLSSCFMRCS